MWEGFFTLIPSLCNQYFLLPTNEFVKVMFSQVTVCPQGVSAPLLLGVCIPACRADTPWDQRQTPPGPPPGRHPLGRHPSRQTPPADIPLSRHQLPSTCWDTHPLCSACWDMVNKWVVCIPLECILVRQICRIMFTNVLVSYHTGKKNSESMICFCQESVLGRIGSVL